MKRTKIFKVIVCLSIFSILVSSTFPVSAATVASKQGTYKTTSGAVFGAYIGARSTGKWIASETVSAGGKKITYKHQISVKTVYLASGGKTKEKTITYAGPTTATEDYYLQIVPSQFKSGAYTGWVFTGKVTCKYTASLIPEANPTIVTLHVTVPGQTC